MIRRLVGVTLAILALGLGRLGFHYAQTTGQGYQVTAVLGDAGSGLDTGSDVKLRGVLIGEVVELDYREGRAYATLELDHQPKLPRDLVVAVTAKTLLGEKQVELRPDGPLEPPYLQAGDILEVPSDRFPTEVQDVVANLERVFEGVEPGDLAALIDALGAFDRTDAELVARNIDQGAELADFGARTAEEQLARLSALADVLESLGPAVDDINRLNRSLPRWVGLLPDRQADIRAALDALSSFSIGLAELLEVERPTIDRLLVSGEAIGQVLDPRMQQIGNLVHGIYRYSRMFGEHGGSLDDGTEHSWFRAHLGDEGQVGEMCASLPPELEDAAPGCVVDEQG